MNDGSYCTWTLMFGDLHGSTICSSNILHQAQGKVKMQGIGFPLVICQAEQGCPLLAGLPQKLQHGSWVIMPAMPGSAAGGSRETASEGHDRFGQCNGRLVKVGGMQYRGDHIS